jgi:hypothetical protein
MDNMQARCHTHAAIHFSRAKPTSANRGAHDNSLAPPRFRDLFALIRSARGF